MIRCHKHKSWLLTGLETCIPWSTIKFQMCFHATWRVLAPTGCQGNIKYNNGIYKVTDAITNMIGYHRFISVGQLWYQFRLLQ